MHHLYNGIWKLLWRFFMHVLLKSGCKPAQRWRKAESDTVKQFLAEEQIHFFSSRCYGCKRLINNSSLQDSGLFAGGRRQFCQIYQQPTALLTQMDCLASPIQRHISVVMWRPTSFPSTGYRAPGGNGVCRAAFSFHLQIISLTWKLNARGVGLTASADSWTLRSCLLSVPAAGFSEGTCGGTEGVQKVFRLTQWRRICPHRVNTCKFSFFRHTHTQNKSSYAWLVSQKDLTCKLPAYVEFIPVAKDGKKEKPLMVQSVKFGLSCDFYSSKSFAYRSCSWLAAFLHHDISKRRPGVDNPGCQATCFVSKANARALKRTN